MAKKEAKGPQWKARTPQGRKQKAKYVYRSVDELIQSGGMAVHRDSEEDEPTPVEPQKVEIIDMTGKEQRVIRDARMIPSQKPSKKAHSSDDSSDESSESEEEVEKGSRKSRSNIPYPFILK